jgi:hypothetical protein
VTGFIAIRQPANAPAAPRRMGLGRKAQAGVLAIVTTMLLFARRPDQFLHPALWVEDTVVLQAYAAHGWWSILEPVQGYFIDATPNIVAVHDYYIIASKLIALIAFKTSILWAPQIELVLILAFTCAVVIAVALSPTWLPWPFLCAVAILTIPTDSEVFAVSMYALWWGGVLLLVALFWQDDGGLRWLRWFYIVFGGLSSPIIVSAAGLFAVRAACERKTSEYYAAGIAISVALIQLLTISSQQAELHSTRFEWASLTLAVQKFIGFFFYAVWPPGSLSKYIGFAVAAFVILFIWSLRSRLNGYFYLLVLTYMAVCGVVLVRVPAEIIHPFYAGPRYFFYPFIVLSWIMIWLAAVAGWAIRFGVALAFLVALVMAWPNLARYHDPIDWKAEVLACARSTEYSLPMHWTGKSSEMWHVPLTGQQCQQLLDASVF